MLQGRSKYQPLLAYLQRKDDQEVSLSFAQVEELMGEPLPDSARRAKAWWSNRVKGALQASAWMGAGYLANVDLTTETVVFHRPPPQYQIQVVEGKLIWNRAAVRALRLHMGLTQREFANQLGVRQQTVSEWENGKYSPDRSTSKHLDLVAEKAEFQS